MRKQAGWLLAVWLGFMGAASADTSLESCRVVKVLDDNVFEEGLSTHEYPDIDVTRERKGLVVSVGAMLDWEQGEGDFVLKTKDAAGNPVYRFRRKGSGEAFTFTVRRTRTGRREGKLTLKSPGERVRTVAVAYCRK